MKRHGPPKFRSKSGAPAAPRSGKPAAAAINSRGPGRGPRGATPQHTSKGTPPNTAKNTKNLVAQGFAPQSKRERLVIGLHSVREALKVRPHAILRLGLRDDYQRAHQLKELAELAEYSSINVQNLSASALDDLGSGHQGAAAIVTELPQWNLDEVSQLKRAMLIACDNLEDPHNLGSILRSAWLLDAKAVFVPADRSVELTSTVAKVASGGAEHVPVEVVDNLPRALEELKAKGFWVFGLAESGTRFAWDFELPEKIVWVIGSESSGLRITVERVCDELVRLPQVPGGSSFNAAIAGSMAMYESARQAGKSGPGKL